MKEQYNYAFGLLRQANYDKAELALQEFVKLHPKEALTSNARYWLGETFYVRAAYVQAAEVFLEGYQADCRLGGDNRPAARNGEGAIQLCLRSSAPGQLRQGGIGVAGIRQAPSKGSVDQQRPVLAG